jgi:integrase
MSDEEATRRYVADMKFRALLPGTIEVRKRYLRKISKEIGFAEATEQKIIVWLSRDLSSKTRNMYLSTMASFYRWAARGNEGKPIYLDAEGLPLTPTADIAKPRMHPRHPRPMPIDDIRAALANAAPKLRCWIALGAYEGMRCQEIAFLAVEEINEDTMTLEISHGKGDKQRFVPLHPEVLQALKDLPMPQVGRFWGDETAASVSRRGNRFLHSLGIESTMHQLRHFFGTACYRASGGDIILTQGLLGHSSPSTTAGYAAADVSKSAGVVTSLTI